MNVGFLNMEVLMPVGVLRIDMSRWFTVLNKYFMYNLKMAIIKRRNM